MTRESGVTVSVEKEMSIEARRHYAIHLFISFFYKETCNNRVSDINNESEYYTIAYVLNEKVVRNITEPLNRPAGGKVLQAASVHD